MVGRTFKQLVEEATDCLAVHLLLVGVWHVDTIEGEWIRVVYHYLGSIANLSDRLCASPAMLTGTQRAHTDNYLDVLRHCNH